jgi:hypothetical protein
MPALIYDVFNGDADGICALHQLRLKNPCPDSSLVTGVKRDIRLLQRLSNVKKSRITVLDVSLDRNRDDLPGLLERGNQVFYVDHHFSGDIPDHPNLEAHIDPDPQTCTSLIVDGLLHGKYRAWAVVGAFGDNLDEAALDAATPLNLAEEDIARLRETGILLNYNGYGAAIEDLFFAPDELFRQVQPFLDPLDFYNNSPALRTLKTGYHKDLARAEEARPILENSSGRVFLLPGKPWARRVAGVFANRLAREKKDLAHALIMPNQDGSLRISVRAPLDARTGADTLCRRFPSGGGRAAAAGINQLPPAMQKQFLDDFTQQFSRE